MSHSARQDVFLQSFSDSSEPPFVIGDRGTEILADSAAWGARFAEERAIVCRDAFAPALLTKLLSAADRTRFRGDNVEGLGTREVEQPQLVGSIINLLLQRAELLHWLKQVTGRAALAGVEGRLVRARAGAGDALDWHDDLKEAGRELGVTVGLTDTAFTGGRFELRRLNDATSARFFDHTRPGTILIFDLGADLEHRVLSVKSGGPRRVYTGWFKRQPVALE
jgi:Rps23 Pro-64 3,4-dihydroxylase Tpa1-like proline 4-hydroxylase